MYDIDVVTVIYDVNLQTTNEDSDQDTFQVHSIMTCLLNCCFVFLYNLIRISYYLIYQLIGRYPLSRIQPT